MKKSKLKNIIKKSVKQLINEQSGGTYYRYQGLNSNCGNGGIKRIYTGTNDQAGRDAFYQAVGSPQPGQVFGMQHNVYNMGNQQGSTLPAWACWVFLGTTPNAGSSWNSAGINGQCAQQPGGCMITSTSQQFADCQTCYQFGNQPTNVNGCTDSAANNYDPNATVDDGSCIYPCTSYGCTDPAAINYNSTILPNCDQGCVYQSDFGCTDPSATNYDSQAIYDDGSCILPTGPTNCPGCNGGNHTWGNFNNWITNFGNNMTNASWFNAPNQPCQFLANRVIHWQGIQATLGGCSAYYNQLTCKIKHVQATLQPQYNC